MSEPLLSRGMALVLVAGAYVVATAAAITIGAALGDVHPLVVVAVADVAATVIVFACSLAFDNSSFYDAYWSVAPPVIAAYLLRIAEPEVSGWRQALVFLLVAAWAVRLTANWVRGWTGLDHEDWRYVDIRARSGRAYWVVSFFGIHLFPTVVVYLAALPLYPALATGTRPLSPLDALAMLVTAGAIAIETVADEQLRRFRRAARPDDVLATGLWALSRHPNYFGETSFWWGLFLFGVTAEPASWWAIAGPIAITLMFVFASIPMIDRRMLARRAAYGERMRTVSALVPWFPWR